MKVFEKIKLQLENKSLKISDLHRKILEEFDAQAITYLTLLRTLKGQTRLRESTLFQIATALKTTPEEIRKDTEEEQKPTRFIYNKKAYLEIESTNLNFLTGRLVLESGAKTEIEQDPGEKGDFVKWLYGLRGKMTCTVLMPGSEKKYVVEKNKSIWFQSSYPHYFENHATHRAVCLIIQNPKYI